MGRHRAHDRPRPTTQQPHADHLRWPRLPTGRLVAGPHSHASVAGLLLTYLADVIDAMSQASSVRRRLTSPAVELIFTAATSASISLEGA